MCVIVTYWLVTNIYCQIGNGAIVWIGKQICLQNLLNKVLEKNVLENWLFTTLPISKVKMDEYLSNLKKKQTTLVMPLDMKSM